MARVDVHRPDPTPWGVEIVTGPQNHPTQDKIQFHRIESATCRGSDAKTLTGLSADYVYSPYGGDHMSTRYTRFHMDLDAARELVVGLADMLGMGVTDVAP